LELAKRNWIPDPIVGLDAERYNAASQVVSQVGGGVSIDIPWLNGKKYRAEEREAQSELSAAVSDVQGAQTEALGLLRNQLEKIETLHRGFGQISTRTKWDSCGSDKSWIFRSQPFLARSLKVRLVPLIADWTR